MITKEQLNELNDSQMLKLINVCYGTYHEEIELRGSAGITAGGQSYYISSILDFRITSDNLIKVLESLENLASLCMSTDNVHYNWTVTFQDNYYIQDAGEYNGQDFTEYKDTNLVNALFKAVKDNT